MQRPFWILLLLLAGARPRSVTAEDIDFSRDIRPILSDACFRCHGPDERKRKADLRLDTREGLFEDLGGYAAVVPGKPAESELIARITTDDAAERMPPPKSKLHLTKRQVALLEKWVRSGAPWSGHWSFQPIAKPDLPTVRRAEWPRTAIDYFVLAHLETEGLSPSAVESKERLIRRVALDLTGLPPTLDEIDAFLADESPEAYEKVVDRLLTSPSYGERMAWDWLDAARYADTNGFQGDRERTMWPWRDWVVRALNDNMPFDKFTIQQLAGDLLPEATPDTRLATGFCRNQMINGEGGRIPEENRIEYVFDHTETVGTVWLGLTLTCARCHDHKFDPILRREYYQLFAYFNQTPVSGAGGDPQTPPVIEVPSPEETARLKRLREPIVAAASRVEAFETTFFSRAAGEPASASREATNLPDKVQKALGVAVRRRSPGQLNEIEKHFQKSTPSYTSLLRGLRELRGEEEAIEKSIPRVMVMEDISGPRKTHMLTKGLYNQPDEEVEAGVPAVLPRLPEDAPPNRTALARWLVDPSHPLTARVTVNRFWQAFFGAGLVKTPEDFGSQGAKPSHPRLLDWLATEFIRSGWDVKRLHKLIVMSATYRQSARLTPELRERDPENRLLARGPRYRLPAWMIRDQALAVSGLLVHRLGGPPVKPYQPAGVWAEATFGKKRYERDHGEKLYRRSLYTYWRRIVGPTMFFDAARRQTCSVRIARTNSPLHALVTLNDVTYVEAARAMAQRIMDESSLEPTERIAMAFRLATARRPTAKESELLLRRLRLLKEQYAAHPQDARELLKVGESRRNEKLDPVEHAAYTGICQLILNLDEVLTK